MSTKIEWVINPDGTEGETWNPVTGCTKVGPGCKNCFAERMARRLAGRYGYPEAPHHFDVTLRHDRLEQPLKWRKPRMVFVASMGDLFHEDVPDDYIAAVFGIMAASPGHAFQILTKRLGRMCNWFRQVEAGGPEAVSNYLGSEGMTAARQARQEMGIQEPAPPTHQLRFVYDEAKPRVERQCHWRQWPLGNCWLGTSVESSDYLWRVEELTKCPAAVRYLSCEPLLGPIDDLLPWLRPYPSCGNVAEDGTCANSLNPTPECNLASCPMTDIHQGISWVIVGGETGPGARPMHPQWARDIRDQCKAADIPYFHKQNGKWLPGCKELLEEGYGKIWTVCPQDQDDKQPQIMWRVGKKRAGRLLDGQLWEEYPV